MRETRRRVYVASAISRGDLTDNINRAIDAGRDLMRAGFAPLVPHTSAFWGGATHGWVAAPDGNMSKHTYAVATVGGFEGATHADWLGIDIPWVLVSDAVLRLPGESAGADQETAAARAAGIPVFESVAEVVAWGVAEDEPKPPPFAWSATHDAT